MPQEVPMRLLLLLGLCSCTATFAPPLRASHYGAPARLAAHEVEVSGAASNHNDATIMPALAISENVTLEVAGDFGDVWRMGSIGVRVSDPRLAKLGSLALSGDVEGGAGGGIGGMLVCSESEADGCAAPDGRDWDERTAYGVYAGVGGAIVVADWLKPFARARVQVTQATSVPATLWWSAVTGPQVDLGDHVSVYVALGYGGYTNEDERNEDGLLEAGAAVRLGL
jgi:hypothetical protein